MNERLDVRLVSLNLIDSREKAKRLVKEGKVRVNNIIEKKPSLIIKSNDEVTIDSPEHSYVGRGAYKLEKALLEFNIDLNGRICADVGASTGGFTEVMLLNGANKIYAIDVGHDQLAERLKLNERVVNLEGINVRYLSKNEVPEKVSFISIDVSFISLRLIMPVFNDFLAEQGEIVALVKPQFEVGKSNVGKNGLVKSQNIHMKIIKEIIEYMFSIGYNVLDVISSPITGGDGNVEYLVHLKRLNDAANIRSYDYKLIVNDAFLTT